MGLQYKIVYKKGSDNRVANALSRRPHADLASFAISQAQPAWLLTIWDVYQQNATARELLQRLAICTEPDQAFTLRGGVIRKKNRIWLPANTQLQEQIIAAFHASPLGRHSGIPVTLRRLKQLFSWQGMARIVHDFVHQCQICQ
jgi:hypothetical protein